MYTEEELLVHNKIKEQERKRRIFEPKSPLSDYEHYCFVKVAYIKDINLYVNKDSIEKMAWIIRLILRDFTTDTIRKHFKDTSVFYSMYTEIFEYLQNKLDNMYNIDDLYAK